MSAVEIQRRLVVVLAADVVGYSRMTEIDEAATIADLRKIWTSIFNPAIATRHGRIVKMLGDGALVEFGSVVDAVESAVAIQRAMSDRNLAATQPVEFRIGINLGEIIVEGNDILGEGVNIASRLESQAQPGGILTSDAVHAQVNGKVGIVFNDAGEIKLKNIERPLQVWQWNGERGATSNTAISKPTASSTETKPSIAVLPFAVTGRDPEQEFFADGLVEDIITTLSKLSGLSVIARNSSFVYKGRAVDVRQVSRELGVRFLLEGSVRKAGNRIRITTQLIDASTGIHIWADRFDREIEDIFAIQDEITMVLATEMQVRLTDGEQARMRYTTTTNVAAWSLWIQGLNYYRSSFEEITQARGCWEKALKLDPGSAPLNATLGFLHFVNARHHLTQETRESEIEKSEAYIARALAIDPENADSYRAASGVLLLKSQFDEAAAAARRALKLGPNLPEIAMFASFVLTCTGHASEGIVYILNAIAMNPNHSSSYLGVLGNAYRLAGRNEEATAAFRRYHARSPGYGLADIIMIEEQAGHIEKARETAKQLVAARPTFTVSSWLETQLRVDKEQMAADQASLRAAGIPDR